MAKKKHQRKTSKALIREVSFVNQQMTVKRKIDLLINDMGFTAKEDIIGGRNHACQLSNGTKRYVFDRKAEIEYIDQLLSANNISTTPISKVPVKQKLQRGAIASGPSHKKGGIKVEAKGQTVAEIEGGEIVINAAASEKHCNALSKINESEGNGIAFDCSKKTQMEEDVVFAKHGARLCSESTETQTLLFDKKIFSLENAMDWIYRHNYTNATDVDETENKYRFRQQEPSKFKKDSFRTIHFGDGIEAVIGHPIKKAERGAQVSTCGCHSADNETQYAAKGAIIGTKKNSISVAHQEAYNINKEIENLIDQKDENPDNYTSEEKNRLRFYSGYGGIVSEDITLEQAKQSFTEYYTPDEIVKRMWALAHKNGFIDGHSVLEPSVGTGQFLKYVPEQSMATGYEINKYSYTICKILYPKYNFFLQPFEEIFIKNRDSIKSKISDLPKYNLVIGNPPYGDVGGFGMGMGEKSYTKAGNWIEYFLVRGLDLILPGGLLIYIIGTEVANGGIPFLQQGPSKTKEMIAERADLIDAYRLPNGVFDRTDVLTDILVFKHK